MSKEISGFGKYLTFGLRNDWLVSYLQSPTTYLCDNSLGNKQVDSLKAWLKDAQLLNKDNLANDLTFKLKEIYLYDELLVWQIILINLYYNSSLINFYLLNFNWNIEIEKIYIESKAQELVTNSSERTIRSGINSLINIFDSSPLGEKMKIGLLVKKGKTTEKIKKLGCDNIHPKAIAYSIYKYAESKNKYNFTVSELYEENQNEGPYKIFGISKNYLEKSLRFLQEKELLSADLIAGLDNVNLNKNLSSEKII